MRGIRNSRFSVDAQLGMNEAATGHGVGGHGGNLRALALRAGCHPKELLDFSANINPLGMPPAVRAALVDALDALAAYPDPDCTALRAAVAQSLGVAPDRLLPGNGAEQLIWWLPRLLRARRLVVMAPSYLDYRRAAAVWGLQVASVALRVEDHFAVDLPAIAATVRDGDLVWLAHPNNPTGRLLDIEAVAAMAISRPDVWWVIDEAFVDFVAEADSAVRLAQANIITVRSMTKFFALPGLRLGYAILAPPLAAAGRRLLPEWSVGTPAQAAGVAAVTDPTLADFTARTQQLIRAQRALLAAGLRGLGAAVVGGAANYLLWRLPRHAPGAIRVADALLRDARIAVRTCGDYPGLDDRWLRVAVRHADENARLLAGIEAVLGDGSVARSS